MGLMFLWWTSIVMAAAALAWMVALIVARLLRDRREARRAEDRRRVQQAFLDVMAGSGDAIGPVRGIARRARLTAEALLDVLALVRGAERERLISALAGFGIDDRFRWRLTRGSEAGRIAAAEALSIFPDERNRVALREALGRARTAGLRVALMRSLIDLGAPVDLREVVGDLGRRRGAESLLYLPLIARLVGDDPEAALRLFADADLPGQGRVVLAEALGRSGDFRAIEPLALTAFAPDVELRIASIRGLAALGHPAAEASVTAGLSDPAWTVRSAACEAAGRIGLRSTIPLLSEHLGDPVWWVRFRAGEALAALGATGRDELRSAAVAGGPLAQRTASMVLAERGLSAEAG